MFLAKWTKSTGTWEGGMQDYGAIQILPSSIGLNYCQSIFEGIKAYKTKKGRVVFFRPEQNAQRFQHSADGFSLPIVPQELFLNALTACVKENQSFIPPNGKGSLYLRPVMFGSGVNMTLTPSDEATFMIYVTPIGNYYPGSVGMYFTKIAVTDEIDRQGERGAGNIKQGGNYAPAFKYTLKAKQKGYDDLLFLDVQHHKYITEQTGANFFMVQNNKLITPPVSGAILNGVTRRSLIELAKTIGLQVEERAVHIDEAMQADECFCCGTAVIVSPYEYLTYGEKTKVFKEEGKSAAPIASKLFDLLVGIQQETQADNLNWVKEVDLK